MLVRPLLIGIQHFALVVSDLDRSRRFYGEQLGMEERQRPPNFTFGGAWYRAGGQEIHLILAGDTTSEPGWKDPGASARAGLAMHLAVEVDNLDAERARLESVGLGLFAGPLERGDGIVQLYVEDPDGHLVELFERTGADQSGAAERAPVRGAP
jgi:catechol 2,3-dioxygenase-like lactoylglutathione lyase family enzyme